MIAVLCVFAPSLLLALFLLTWGVVEWCRRIRGVASCCSHKRQHVVVEVDDARIWLCQLCDSGDLVDGQWQFDEPVAADHTL